MLEVRLAMSGPHDLFARYTFGHPERAEAELRAVLPTHVVSEVDWSSLRHLVVVLRYLLWVGQDAAVHAAAKRVLHSVLDRQRAEELMGSWAEEMIERGVQKGRAEYILRILTARGVHVDEAARQRILGCTALDTLDRWFDRALNATTLSDVLDDLAQ